VSAPSRQADPVRRLAWLLPVAFGLHEAEEWKIVAWTHANFTPRTDATDAGARTLLVVFTLLAFVYTAAASRLPSTRAMLLAILPLYVVAAFGNALTHAFWMLHFGAYVPGVLSAVLLVAPLTLYVSWRAVRERLVPTWYVGALFLLALLPLPAIVRAGSTLTPQQVALHRLAARVGAWLWGA
jgi:hypothetical protein